MTQKPIILTQSEIRSKFDACGMPEVIRHCKSKNLKLNTILKHKRERVCVYIHESNTGSTENSSTRISVATLIHWENAGGDEEMLPFEFTCPEDGQQYALRLVGI